MKTYEITYLISSELSQEEAENTMSQVESLLSEEGGILIENKKERTVNLGYKVKKQKGGFLAVLKFQIEPKKAKKFQKTVEKRPEILRCLLSIPPKKIAKTEKPRKKGLKKAKIETRPESKKEKAKRKESPKEKKVELKEIEKKLEEILGE